MFSTPPPFRGETMFDGELENWPSKGIDLTRDTRQGGKHFGEEHASFCDVIEKKAGAQRWC